MSHSQSSPTPYENPPSGGQNDVETHPAMVFLLGIITFGLYIIYWYYSRYRQLEALSGRTPTGNSFLFDFLLMIVTCSLWHVYMDYRISMQCNDLQREYGLPENDTSTLTVVLDVAGYLTGLVSTAIHQDQINKIVRARPQGQLQF